MLECGDQRKGKSIRKIVSGETELGHQTSSVREAGLVGCLWPLRRGRGDGFLGRKKGR